MRFGLRPNCLPNYSFQKLLSSERGDVFIFISLAIAVVIFSSVAGYQLLLANKGRANLLITESTDGFLFNELNAWNGYFRKIAGLPDLATAPPSAPDGEATISGLGGGALGGGGIRSCDGEISFYK